MKKSALILIDYQNEWLDENSDNFIRRNLDKEIECANKLLNWARNHDVPVIFIKHIEPNSNDSFAENSFNSEILKGIKRKDDDIIIEKKSIGPFYQTDLYEKLGDAKHLIIVGILTNLCLRSAVEEAYDRDFEITVIKNCCVSHDKKTQDFTFSDLKNTRPEINFTEFNDFIK